MPIAINWARATSTRCTADSRNSDLAKDDPMNVVDGSNFSAWTAALNEQTAEFLLDFQTLRLIDRISIAFGTRTPEPGQVTGPPAKFRLLTSLDASTWIQLAAKTDGDFDATETEPGVHVQGSSTLSMSWPCALQSRYLKLELLKLGKGQEQYGIHQIQAWGAGDEGSATAILNNCVGKPTYLYTLDGCHNTSQDSIITKSLIYGTIKDSDGTPHDWEAPNLSLSSDFSIANKIAPVGSHVQFYCTSEMSPPKKQKIAPLQKVMDIPEKDDSEKGKGGVVGSVSANEKKGCMAAFACCAVLAGTIPCCIWCAQREDAQSKIGAATTTVVGNLEKAEKYVSGAMNAVEGAVGA